MKTSLKFWILASSLSLVTLVPVACGVEGVEKPPPTEQSRTSQVSHRSNDPTEHQVRVDFPLALGNTWVYSGTFYQGFNPTTILTATYTATERVVDVLHSELEPYTIFQIARYEDLVFCPEEWQERSENWCASLASDEPEYYWYVVDGRTVYRQQRLEVYRLHERGIKELVLPLAEGEQWYLSAAMAEANPNYEVDSMLRHVEQRAPREVPAGDFGECFRMVEVIGGNYNEMWVCTEIGIVERATDHRGTPFGEHEVLIDYVFPE